MVHSNSSKAYISQVKNGRRRLRAYRTAFASILAKRGVDSLHITRLGRWESISMVERYTGSVKFEDSLKLYQSILN